MLKRKPLSILQGLALNKNASSLSAGYDYLRHSPRLLRSASSRLGASFRGNTQRAASSPRDSPTLPVRAISGFAGQDYSIGEETKGGLSYL